jgi:hypothetical protein
MNKIVIAAVAATLLGSTSLALAEPGSDTYNGSSFYATAQQPHAATARDARAQIVNGRQAVKPFTAQENAWFVIANPVTAN